MEQETRIGRRRKSEMFWKLIRPLIIVIIFGSAVLFANGCGGGGGGSDGSKAENSDQNQNSNNPPADNSTTTPPSDNTDTTPPPDVKTAGLIQLPKTGQIVSYAIGDDGDIQAGAARPNPRFTDNGDGTVTDELTGLMWTKDANLAKRSVNFSSSIYQYFSQTRPGGYSDWRLPSIYELESLVDASQARPALPADNPFLNVMSAYYWTSTDLKPSQYQEVSAVVDFSNGAVYMLGKDIYYGYIWGVRSGVKKGVIEIPQVRGDICYEYLSDPHNCVTGVGITQPSPRLIDNKDGTVTDNLTGMMWTKKMNLLGAGIDWNKTLEYVAAMNRGERPNFGYIDWRVPNRKELFYMLDWTNNPFSNFAGSGMFTDEVGAIWSSTTVAGGTDSAWMYFVLANSIRIGTKNGTPALWPVRTVPAK